MLSFDFFILLSGLSLAAISVYLFTSALFTNNTDAEALAWASGNEPAKSKSPIINISRPLIHNFTLQHAQRIKSVRYRKNVTYKILTAGLSREINVDEFIGMQILWGLFIPMAFCVFDFGLQMNMSYIVAVGIGLVGLIYPHVYCSSQKRKRYVDVVSDLPFFIDLMALS